MRKITVTIGILVYLFACYVFIEPATVNMQYQDKADSLLKDRWERTKEGCALTCNSSNSTKNRQVFNCK